MINTTNIVAMVLNALEVDPKRRWKGNWRWFSGMFTLQRYKLEVNLCSM